MTREPRQFEAFPMSFSDASAAGYFRAYCENIVDGDTVDVFVDLGFFAFSYVPIRLKGVNTAELRGTGGAEHDSAVAAFELTRTRALDQQILLRSFKGDRSFDRFVGDILVPPSAAELSNGAVQSFGDAHWMSLKTILIAAGLGEATD